MMRDEYELVKCNLCGSDSYSVCYEQLHNFESGDDLIEKFKSSGDEQLLDQVVCCKECGLLFVNPRLRPELIVQAYAKGEDPVFVSQNPAREETFKKCLSTIEKMHPQKGVMCDIGTAGGAFLKVCKDGGWEVKGCEPNRWLCNWAKENYGIDVFPGTLFEHNLNSDSCDVVTLWDVIEHTSDPKRVLERCHELLKENGKIVVNFPDVGSIVAKLMKRKWVFMLSVHLYYFTKKTMRELLKEVGFSVVVVKPHVQYLEAHYIFKRAKAYIGVLADIPAAIMKLLGLTTMRIPYWMGQTLVVAEKIQEKK